jgi:hypothetical protein
MTLPYPYPQTAGKDRNVVLADQTTFDGLPFRPTQTEAESLFRTSEYAAMNWFRTPYDLQYSRLANIEESRAKAALIGGESGGGYFDGIMDLFGKETKEKIYTIADYFDLLYRPIVQSRTPPSPVPGSPPAPGEIHILPADREKAIKERILAAESWFGSVVSQVKGLFGMGYPSSAEKKPSDVPVIAGVSLTTLAVILFILYILTR